MDTFLYHHGIKGQKWGVIRTPEELGHAPSGGQKRETGAVAPATGRNSTGKFSLRSLKPGLSDEALQKRIQRLNMEEQYENLLARRKERNTGPVKRALRGAMKSLGDKLLSAGVDKLFKKITSGGKREQTPKELLEGDTSGLDFETMQRLAKWVSASRLVSAYQEEHTPPPGVVRQDGSMDPFGSYATHARKGTNKKKSSES